MAIVQITKENFDTEVLQCKQTVLLDFYTEWCGPCQMIGPVLKEIAAEREDVKICKIDADQQMELARRFKVTSIPLLVVMKEGQVVAQSLGLVPKQKILDMI